MKLRIAILAVALALIAACGRPPAPPAALAFSSAPQLDTTWPWPSAHQKTIAPGVSHWTKNSGGSRLHLFRFRLDVNPKLEFGIYDQDQHDGDVGNNLTDHQRKSVAGAVRELNTSGKVIAACNGMFFGYDRSGYETKAAHIGPVVLEGKPQYNVGGPNRWTFGITKTGVFKTAFRPGFKDLGEFRFAADGAQCLIREAQPLKIEPYPTLPIPPGTKLPRVEPTPKDAGHIPIVDHIRTSRTSFGWSKDSKTLYMLIVYETDGENESARRLRAGEELGDGWNLFDLQRFWASVGVWGAVNSDGGIVTQLISLRPEGDYEMLASRTSQSSSGPWVISPELENVPDGGTLMYFFVRERK